MSTLDLEFDFDSRISKLELEWRQAFEAHLAARSAYASLASDPQADVCSIDRARERLEQSEAAKSQILDKMDRLERRVLSRHYY